MTVRTWRQANALMAQADEALSPDAVQRAGVAAQRRADVPRTGGMLLVKRPTVDEARIANDLTVDARVAGWAEVTEIKGDHGWALCWVGA